MSASNDLRNSYASWRGWTEAESAALRQGNWEAVARCQEAKSALQPVIAQFTAAAEEEWRQSRNGAVARSEIQMIIRELIVLEESNRAALAVRQEGVARRRLELKQAARNLGRVQHSYVSRTASSWHSYS